MDICLSETKFVTCMLMVYFIIHWLGCPLECLQQFWMMMTFSLHIGNLWENKSVEWIFNIMILLTVNWNGCCCHWRGCCRRACCCGCCCALSKWRNYRGNKYGIHKTEWSSSKIFEDFHLFSLLTSKITHPCNSELNHNLNAWRGCWTCLLSIWNRRKW